MQEYVIGNIIGISQVIIGYPFDTIKTNLQNNNNYIIKPATLYKGVMYPLLLNSLSTSCVFGTYDYINNTYNNKLYAGVITGIINAIIISPFDYKKIHMQILNKPIMITSQPQHMLKTYYNGFRYTLSREVISIPIYFYSYYYLIDNNYANSFFAGGIAGVNSWLFTYPLDTLKTRAQLQHNPNNIITIKNLYKGLPITLIRAFIVNSFSFYLYDVIKKIIHKN